LYRSDAGDFECIVVDDGSTDGSAAVALEFGAALLSLDRRRGPARARNLGARAAKGEILLFLDADVWVQPDTLRRVREFLERNPAVSAVFGSYDDQPFHRNFLSQYKNLAHAFVHRTALPEASTFWTGCGAVRRDAFFELGGFDERCDRPACEDIELGYRLKLAGRRIRLDPTLQVKHLKRWTFWGLVRTDLFERSVPWTDMILRHRFMPNYLNLQTGQRLSVALAVALAPAAVAVVFWGLPAAAAALVLLAAYTALNLRLSRFLAARRGVLFALAAIPIQLLSHFYSGVTFGVCLARHLLRRHTAGEPESERAPAVHK
jgi:glycosyltransferase involved in cell wall biosynthesis